MIDICIDQLLTMEKAIPIDVRSPEEFNESTIPNAVNIALFSDEERKEVGTIYKHAGPEKAKWRAMEIVSPKLPELLTRVKNLAETGGKPVLFCWRGGMRSQSLATFLDFAGFPVHRIIGGYRAYREYILAQIPELIPTQTVVLHGMTGVGKTDILTKLTGKGYPVLDLEGAAAHKGSIFGAMGSETDGNNQKTFDSLLFTRLKQLEGAPYIIVEAESKRIGKVTQPEELLITKKGGIHFIVEASVETRVKRIYHEYVEPFIDQEWFYPMVKEKFEKIQKRIKDVSIKTAVNDALEQEDYHEFIRLLLLYYYDPRYEHKQLEYEGEFIHINSDDEDEAVKQIALKLDEVFTLQQQQK
ncbi:tRNA 2-selenouridine(34) synthase MnmH [Bacillus sp. DNRA2]|uniref:tRNA 2-selenouridine(34) synthase MnmH n=1 Tax=Bacillus sp. DNRA2 TaxID=2723053 RepID=UPI00145E4441|nr:tRNA 2-selenouridine(34) synthase MnmH [Bacillus sp. DNRA2]NMD69959.1 tRNA 2-selenouridine(34) synthase MnmH [Bacillus sp. DNRA2]